MDNTAIHSARVEISSMDTQSGSVLPGPGTDPAPRHDPSHTHGSTDTDVVADAPRVVPPARPPIWAVVAMTIAAQIVLFVLVASVWPLERYESAPGVAQEVAPRVVIEDAEVYEPAEGPLFVTATTSELTGLQALMGWFDDTVDVRTCEEQFGTCDPDQLRQVSLGAMSTTKEIAEYVALERLGFEAELVPGPAQIGSFSRDTCPSDAPPLRACKVLQVGDVFSEIDGNTISVVDDLVGVVDGRQPGDVIEVTVAPPGGTPRRVEVELMAAPDDPSRTIIGFLPRDTRTVEVPISIDIDTDRIGGPSAGLSFVLTLIDLLSEGELIRNERVAVTGTINETGAVGPIGALPQKAESVRRAGATLFIVPAGQADSDLRRARDIAGPGVDIVEVASLDEALALLAERGGDPISAKAER
jgi:Lon-like protease